MKDIEIRNHSWRWAIGIAALTIAGIVGLNLWPRTEEAPAPKPQAAAPTPTSAPSAEPVIEHPLPPPANNTPALPALADSDTLAQQALAGLLGNNRLHEWFHTDQLIRRIVVTVDNLPRAKLTQRQSPFKPIAGSLAVTQNADALALDAANAQRYTPFVQLFSKLDMRQVATLYRQFYPLFQSAYVELGYPKGYFNDRLVAVIDHLLATPEPTAPLALTQPKVLYEFADPELEARSAGQKTLLRMGVTHTRQVKAKLRELRAQLTAKT